MALTGVSADIVVEVYNFSWAPEKTITNRRRLCRVVSFGALRFDASLINQYLCPTVSGARRTGFVSTINQDPIIALIRSALSLNHLRL